MLHLKIKYNPFQKRDVSPTLQSIHLQVNHLQFLGGVVQTSLISSIIIPGRNSVIFAGRATNLPRSSILQESFSPRSAAESREKAVVDGLREGS